MNNIQTNRSIGGSIFLYSGAALRQQTLGFLFQNIGESSGKNISDFFGLVPANHIAPLTRTPVQLASRDEINESSRWKRLSKPSSAGFQFLKAHIFPIRCIGFVFLFSANLFATKHRKNVFWQLRMLGKTAVESVQNLTTVTDTGSCSFND